MDININNRCLIEPIEPIICLKFLKSLCSEEKIYTRELKLSNGDNFNTNLQEMFKDNKNKQP